VRADDHSCDEIAENDGLFQSLKYDGGYCRRAEDEREILKKCVRA
jgi:hypothetical protein